MINAEKYKKQLRSINRDTAIFERWGFDKRTNSFTQCGCMYCKNCVINDIEKNERKNYVGCNHARMKWLLSEYKEPIKLSKLEYDILKYISDNTRHMYIARNKSRSLCVHSYKPVKDTQYGQWTAVCDKVKSCEVFNNLFPFIKWEDEEPTSIKEVLDNYVVIDDEREGI